MGIHTPKFGYQIGSKLSKKIHPSNRWKVILPLVGILINFGLTNSRNAKMSYQELVGAIICPTIFYQVHPCGTYQKMEKVIY